jgi:hypothetical protein
MGRHSRLHDTPTVLRISRDVELLEAECVRKALTILLTPPPGCTGAENSDADTDGHQC